MGFFTVGNLLTVIIVLILLILYRSLDKRSRSPEKFRKYTEKLRDDLASFVEERERTVRNLGIELQVETDSAKELMNRIKTGYAEFSEKITSADQIEQRLNAYDSSLQELVKMTARVQENLNRIHDESAFVDGAYRRVTESKAALEGLETGLESMVIRFRQESSEALKKNTEEAVADIASTVSGLRVQVDSVDQTLKTVMEQAEIRAGRMEESVLSRLKEQSQDRIEKIKASEEERIQVYQESARSRSAEISGQIRAVREEWRAEKLDWEAKEKALKDEFKNDMEELKNLAAQTGKKAAEETGALEKRLDSIKTEVTQTLSVQENLLLKSAEDMKQKALEATAVRLEEYRDAQNAEFRRLETLADDSRKLDSELRHYMQETAVRVQNDFSVFAAESAKDRRTASAEFDSAVSALKSQMDNVQNELDRLKTTAYENVSGKIEVFENEFLSELDRRSAEMDRQFLQWQNGANDRLAQLDDEETRKRGRFEQEMTAEIRDALADRNAKIMAELEKLKSEAGAFEEGIRGHMNAADVSLASYRDELDHNLEEARQSAEDAIKAEIGSLGLATADAIKLNQRDTEKRLREITDYAENRSREIQELLDNSRQNIIDQDNRISSIRSAMDSIHREAEARRDEIISRTNEQAKTLEAGIQTAERQIKEFFEQAKIIDHTDELRLELGRHIEDLKADMDRLEQRRAEAAQLESQFIKVRRLEDDVNAKMTRFLSEGRRIEQMDAEFNRLIQTSRAVDEKLREVSASDDMLQQIQVQLRRIGETFNEAEEKYQRIEKKGQVLDSTNEGIDRNFKSLQESEKALEKISMEMGRLNEDIRLLRNSIEKVAEQSEKARDAAEQVAVLDATLSAIDDRITAMQSAREWIARAETRLDEINRDILGNIRLVGETQRKKGGKTSRDEPGAPPINVRENVIKLATQGWKIEEIAKNFKLSISEVELILETAPRE